MGAVPERGGDGLGGGGGGGRGVTIKEKDLSKLTLFCLLIFDGSGGYLSGEDVRGGRGGVEAAADRDGGGVLTEDVMRPSVSERIFLYKEKEE